MPDAKRCRLECINKGTKPTVNIILYRRTMVKYLKQRKKYSFRNNELLVDYVGNRIVGMSSEGKRLCFFKEVNK